MMQKKNHHMTIRDGSSKRPPNLQHCRGRLFRQLQRKRSNRLLEHLDAAIDPSDGGETNLSSLSRNS